MLETAKQMKENFKTLRSFGLSLSPRKMNIFRFAPVCILNAGLVMVFKSHFGKMFMYQHSMNAPDEMRRLHPQFYQYIKINEKTGL